MITIKIPYANVNKIICNKDVSDEILDFFKSRNIETVFSKCLSDVKGSLNTHPDIQIVCVDGVFITAPETYDYYKNSLVGKNIISGITEVSSPYPKDVPYNIALFGDKAVYSEKYTDPVVLNHIKNKKLISVKQGYSKCTLCIVSENAVITEDKGMCKSLSAKGVDVLLISSGSVKLEGFEYGFLGGSSLIVSNKEIAFSGDITAHPDYKYIYDFCSKYGKIPVSMSKQQITDYGSFIPV